MSAYVKLGDTSAHPVPVDLNMFEKITYGQAPWTRRDEATGKIRRYGLCPECHNPMQLINIDNANPAQIPHGRHRLRPVHGFDHCIEEILNCSLFDTAKKDQLLSEARELTPEAIERREFLVRHFNLVLGILQEDLGFSIGAGLADKILETYFEDTWYRWPQATIGNLPWLLARTTKAYSLYGQKLRPGTKLCNAVLSNVPEAALGPWNKLIAKPGMRFYLEFGVRNHRIRYRGERFPAESIEFYVVRPAPSPETRPDVIFEQTIDIRSDVFLRRCANAIQPEGYGLSLIRIARTAHERYLHRHPAARGTT